jgi:K(+)-stimulated pyrophosphate-energized sodium pump
MIFIKLSILISVIAIVFSIFNTLSINKIPTGNEEMKRISDLISEGARTYLNRQYKVLVIFVIFIALILLLVNNEQEYYYFQSIAFICGAFASAIAGFIGMDIATKANVRTANYASKGIKEALNIAFVSGSIMGINVVGIGLLCLSVLFYSVFNITESIDLTLDVLTGFSLGASSIALFARVGGGIYTKAADISADLVGKLEAGIPEDDPRNPAVIADNVGDNVGDIAGMGADLFESYAGTIVATMIIGSTIMSNERENISSFVILPLILASIGIVTSIVGILFIKYSKNNDPQKILNRGNHLSVLLTIILSCIAIYKIIPTKFLSIANDRTFYVDGIYTAIVLGIFTGIGIGTSTEYYCSKHNKPVNEIVKASLSGHATNIIAGLYVGMESTVLPIIFITSTIIISNNCAGIYGISLSAMSMLSTVGIQLAIDAYGPIVDNAGGIAVMSNMSKSVRKVTDHLDAVGNTTAAIGKGFAIGSAALTAFALFNAYQSKVTMLSKYSCYMIIDISKPHVVAGMFIGGTLPFIFSSLTIKAVNIAAQQIISEIREQFKKNPNILAGTESPDYKKCIDYATVSAIKGMIKPGLLAIIIPIISGFIDKTGLFLAGVLIGSTVTGVLMAIFMANTGGAWDNAKKQIEESISDLSNLDAKEQHAAAITGDTVGDPFKDTAGPSINILIKLMSIVSLMIVPMTIKYGSSFFV